MSGHPSISTRGPLSEGGHVGIRSWSSQVVLVNLAPRGDENSPGLNLRTKLREPPLSSSRHFARRSQGGVQKWTEIEGIKGESKYRNFANDLSLILFIFEREKERD